MGKGSASLDAVFAAVQARGYAPANDGEAVAIALLLFAEAEREKEKAA